MLALRSSQPPSLSPILRNRSSSSSETLPSWSLSISFQMPFNCSGLSLLSSFSNITPISSFVSVTPSALSTSRGITEPRIIVLILARTTASSTVVLASWGFFASARLLQQSSVRQLIQTRPSKRAGSSSAFDAHRIQ